MEPESSTTMTVSYFFRVSKASSTVFLRTGGLRISCGTVLVGGEPSGIASTGRKTARVCDEPPEGTDTERRMFV